MVTSPLRSKSPATACAIRLNIRRRSISGVREIGSAASVEAPEFTPFSSPVNSLVLLTLVPTRLRPPQLARLRSRHRRVAEPHDSPTTVTETYEAPRHARRFQVQWARDRSTE